jgi:hypothetical protein
MRFPSCIIRLKNIKIWKSIQKLVKGEKDITGRNFPPQPPPQEDILTVNCHPLTLQHSTPPFSQYYSPRFQTTNESKIKNQNKVHESKKHEPGNLSICIKI